MDRTRNPPELDLHSLMNRVPFSSLTGIIFSAVSLSAIALGAFACLAFASSLDHRIRQAIVHAIAVSGLAAFVSWSLLPRRNRYLGQFRSMLAQEPIVSWTYTETEWTAWQKYVNDLDYPRRVPKKLFLAGVVFGAPAGLFLALTDNRGRPALAVFVESYILCASICSLLAATVFLYWRTLLKSWKQRSGETLIFEHGVFFHHRFIDWSSDPEMGVRVEVEQSESPIAVLVVSTQKGQTGLAPLMDFHAPIPFEQVETAIELARSLSQNVNTEDDMGESE